MQSYFAYENEEIGVNTKQNVAASKHLGEKLCQKAGLKCWICKREKSYN